MKAAILTREAILGKVLAPVGTVDVPELGGAVGIAGLTADRADAAQRRKEEAAHIPFNVWATITFACDGNGDPLFTDDDAAALGKLSSEALTAITVKALDLNGLSKKAADDAKNGSGATGNDSSGTGSPSPSDEQSQS